jgi:hypothetical protein
LYNAQETEPRALNLLKHPELKIIHQNSGIIKTMKRNQWYQQHIPISLARQRRKLPRGRRLMYQEVGFSTFRSSIASDM